MDYQIKYFKYKKNLLNKQKGDAQNVICKYPQLKDLTELHNTLITQLIISDKLITQLFKYFIFDQELN